MLASASAGLPHLGELGVAAAAREGPIGYSLDYEQFSRNPPGYREAGTKRAYRSQAMADAHHIEESPDFLDAVD